MSNPISIVYIEDNAANLALVTRILDATGRYRVLGAMDGETGLDLVQREHPRLVLVDLDIPGVNGFEVMRQIKASTDPAVAGTTIVVVTANVMTHERDQALAAGAAGFIEKPFDIQSFRESIDTLAGQSSPDP